MTHADARDRAAGPRSGAGYWFILAMAVLLVLLGLAIGAGGVWLILLDGSWYYLFAGIGLLVSGIMLAMPSIAGVWIYGVTWVFTLVWAFWEKGLNGWAQVPRLVAPTVILILLLCLIPALLRRRDATRGTRNGNAPVAAGIALALLAGGGFYAAGHAPDAVADGTEAPVTLAQAPEQTPPRETPPGEGAGQPAAPQVQPPPGIPEDAPAAPRRQPMAMLETGENWPAYGGTYHAQRFSPLDQITKDNVGRLEQVWEYHTGALPEEGDGSEGAYSPETTPLVVDGTMYLCSAMNHMMAVDADTGKERWRYDAGVSTDAIPYGATCRGVAYYAAPDMRSTDPCATRIIEGTLDARLIAVDARTGTPCADFGQSGIVSLLDGIGDTVPGFFSMTSPPTIVRGVIVTNHQVNDNQQRDAPSGVVRGYDVMTGELLWAWDLAQPALKGLPPEGETYSRGTPNTWTAATGDDELGLVYLPMGNAAVDYYGADRRPESNEYATSIVALDVETGEPAWHFQTVHYDVWDYDLGSQATLVDFPSGDRSVPALVLSSKQGDIYVLNRETGEPLFEAEERQVPTGGVEPDNLSPTQPFSTYHTLRKPDLAEKDMWGMSPLDQLWCRIQFRRARYDGIYTPPTADRYWIQYPGYNGGSDWGGVSVDPERGIVIANYNDMPNHNRLLPRQEVDALNVRSIMEGGSAEGAPDEVAPMAGVPYGIDVNAGWRVGFTGLLCKEPPYGGIRAIDLESGETLWDRPLGTARANGPFGIHSGLPFVIGTPNNGGSVITASGLVFIAATTDDLFRAIDEQTGEVLWQTELPAGGQATPITYSVDGRQYVALMAGGHHFMETQIGDSVLAWALPAGED